MIILEIISRENFFKKRIKIKTVSEKTDSLSQAELHWSLQDTRYAKRKRSQMNGLKWVKERKAQEAINTWVNLNKYSLKQTWYDV